MLSIVRSSAPVLFSLLATSFGCATGDTSAAAPSDAREDGASDARSGDAAAFDVTSPDAPALPRCIRVDYLNSDDAGADGVWGTSDDRLVGHMADLLDDLSRSKTHISFRTAGPDGVWGTADDEIQGEDVYDYASTGDLFPKTRTQHMNAGPDGVWLTSDDSIGVVERYAIDSSGRMRGSIAYLRDAAIGATSYKTPVGAKLPRDYLYSVDPGPDGVYATSDDVFNGRTEDLRDALGVIQLSFGFSKPGPDGVWGDDDDVIDGVLIYDCARQTFRASRSPGADGVWGNADDKIVSAWRLVTTPSSCGGYDLCRSSIR